MENIDKLKLRLSTTFMGHFDYMHFDVKPLHVITPLSQLR